MNKIHRLAWMVAGLPGLALAHVEYYDLNKGYQIENLTPEGIAANGDHDTPVLDKTYDIPIAGSSVWSGTPGLGPVSVTVNDLTLSGWIDGTRTDIAGAYILGNSHRVDFANFHLEQSALVSINFKTEVGINPSFTVYKGLLVYQGHDDLNGANATDTLNPFESIATEPFFQAIQNTQDDGTKTDWQGNLSPYRDTIHSSNPNGQYAGQFNALAGWSMANANGYWSAVAHIAHVTSDNLAATENSLHGQCLRAGDYTIAFSGAGVAANTDKTPSSTKSNLTGTLTYSATPVDHCDNNPPTVRIAPNPQADEGAQVTIEAEASDPNGDTLSYLWEQTGGPVVAFDPHSAILSFTAPAVGEGGSDLVFRVAVSDNYPGAPLTAVATTTVHVRHSQDQIGCAYAAPSKTSLWPAHKGFANIGILGVGGPQPENIVLRFTGVYSDEPVKGKGDRTAPDAKIKKGKMWLRAERQARGNGRVYTINFEASDGSQSCSGAVQVGVPRRKGMTAIDGGLKYNALGRK